MEYFPIIIFLVFFGVLIYRSNTHIDKKKSSDEVWESWTKEHMDNYDPKNNSQASEKVWRNWVETYQEEDQGWSPEKDVRPVLEKSQQGYSEFQQWILLHAGTHDPRELKTYLKKAFEEQSTAELPPPVGAKYFEWLMGREATIDDLKSIGILVESVEEDSGGEGYVYVIQDLESGLFKIGYTKDPDRRFDELGVGLTAQEISCDFFENAREIEKKAHKKYADSRLPQSEYFKLYKPPIIDME